MANQTSAGMPGFNGLFSRNDGFPSLPGAMEDMLFRSMQVARGDPSGDSVRQMLNPTPPQQPARPVSPYRRAASPEEIAAYQQWANGNHGQLR